MRKVILLLLFFQSFPGGLLAQEDVDSAKTYKNAVRFNLTNPMIFSIRSLIFSYERVLNKHRSFSVNFGQASFPSFDFNDNSDSLRANKVEGESGYHISADYRFYLSKENKYDAPRGVYIAPFFAYNYFEKKIAGH